MQLIAFTCLARETQPPGSPLEGCSLKAQYTEFVAEFMVVISAIYLVQVPHFVEERIKPKGTYPGSYNQGEAEPGPRPNVFFLLGTPD